MTPRMQDVLKAVTRHTLARKTEDASWWRAEGSGQRVTLASLYRGGALRRRAWRGKDGDADAAYEYLASETTLTALGASFLGIVEKKTRKVIHRVGTLHGVDRVYNGMTSNINRDEFEVRLLDGDDVWSVL